MTVGINVARGGNYRISKNVRVQLGLRNADSFVNVMPNNTSNLMFSDLLI